MDTKYIFVVNGMQDAHYDKRIMIANGYNIPASTVRIVEQSGSGVTRVLIVDSDADEHVYIENQGDLPFREKVKILGLPPCPKCGYRLKGYTRASSYGCDQCQVMWPVSQLDLKYRGQEWQPQPGMNR
jgi:hypothetical protein